MNQNALFFKIALEEAKSNLTYEKLQDTAKLIAMRANIFAIRARSTNISIALNEDDCIGKIPNKVKLLAF